MLEGRRRRATLFEGVRALRVVESSIVSGVVEFVEVVRSLRSAVRECITVGGGGNVGGQ